MRIGCLCASAACALGRLGRPEVRGPLVRLLRVAPTLDVIDAVTAVADEECMILLARIARTVPQLPRRRAPPSMPSTAPAPAASSLE